jgi:hypothetical protein
MPHASTVREMKPNENMAIGIVKDNLIQMALEKDGNKRTKRICKAKPTPTM